MVKSHRHRKDQRKHARLQALQFEKSLNNPPRSMVFRRGVVGDSVKDLVRDLRFVMSPFSALNLKERKKDTINNILRTAGQFSVTHLLMLSQTALSLHLRVARIPRGPTVTFRVRSFTTMRSLREILKAPGSFGIEYQHPPLVVLNNFTSNDDHMKVTAAVLQNMFPGLDLSTIKLNNCKRVIMFNYNSDNDTIDVRHYQIGAVPVGLTKGIRKVIKGHIPNLHNREDIADWIENPNSLSDSEAEFDDESKVKLAQDFGKKGNARDHTSAIKLKELGPRLTLEVYRVEDGMCSGRVLYNKYVQKSEEDILAIEMRKQREAELKLQRKVQQDENIQKKQQAKLMDRAKHIEQMKKRAAGQAVSDDDDEENRMEVVSASDDDDDDDRHYNLDDRHGDDDHNIDDDDDDDQSDDDEPQQKGKKGSKKQAPRHLRFGVDVVKHMEDE